MKTQIPSRPLRAVLYLSIFVTIVLGLTTVYLHGINGHFGKRVSVLLVDKLREESSLENIWALQVDLQMSEVKMDKTKAKFNLNVSSSMARNKTSTKTSDISGFNPKPETNKATKIVVTTKAEDGSRELKRRRDQVTSVCQSTVGLHKVYNTKSIISREHSFLYCAVEKTGSTFWRRFFYQLVNTKPMKSPFDVSVQTVLSASFKKYKLSTFDSEIDAILQKYTKLLFVRDPYSRLFSAYVDKLISPNPYYWKVWGQQAIKTYRKNQKGKSCGNDVTFSEFVSFAINFAWRSDAHIMPIDRLCTPCSFNYTVIGKMETFLADTREVLRSLHISEEQVEFDKMEADSVADALEDSSKDSLSRAWLSSTLRCISKLDVAKRILRKLQIRGFVSWRYNLQLSQHDIDTLDSPNFVKILNRARETYPNATELKIQKKQAFLEACRSLDATQVATIDKLYSMDFKLFDYNNEPDCLSNNNLIDTQSLDWTKPWDLTPVL